MEVFMGKILIVEDSESTSNILRDIIFEIDQNQQVEATGYAKEALEIAKQQRFDAFLLDIELFDGSGIELAKKIRKIDRYQFTPIIFITSIISEELLAYQETSCFKFIKKPCNKRELKDVLETIIKFGIIPQEEQNEIKIRQKRFMVSFNKKDIVYIEHVDKKLKFVTVNEIFYVSKQSLSSYEDELSSGFIRCHRSYLVNRAFIVKIDKKNCNIYLKDGYGNIDLGDAYRQNLEGDWI